MDPKIWPPPAEDGGDRRDGVEETRPRATQAGQPSVCAGRGEVLARGAPDEQEASAARERGLNPTELCITCLQQLPDPSSRAPVG
eukprot:10129663-Alexandrium_andersonii.AAC.1